MIDRDRTGAMRPTRLYHCSGCSIVFSDPRAWRDGVGDLRRETVAPPRRGEMGLLPAG